MSRPIIEAKNAYLLQNPDIEFGSQMKENSKVFPFRFPFIKGKTYLLIDAIEPETNCFPIVEEAVFLSFDIEEIYDEETGEYNGYEVFYEWKTETEPNLYFSETVLSETDRMGFFMVYEKQT